jgi:hypothetical protein
MQKQRAPVKQREPVKQPSSRTKPGRETKSSKEGPPPSEPFFESGLREEKSPRSGEEHGGAANAGSEHWAQPGTQEGPPPELAKPTGTAVGAPSEAPKARPGPDGDGDG